MANGVVWWTSPMRRRLLDRPIRFSNRNAMIARARGAELVGELEQYEAIWRLCYVRGPEGIIVELAERIG